MKRIVKMMMALLALVLMTMPTVDCASFMKVEGNTENPVEIKIPENDTTEGDPEYDEDGYVIDDENEDDDEDSGDFGEIYPASLVSSRSGLLKRQRKTRTVRRWPDATIPYSVWGSNRTKKRVGKALARIADKTCLKFKARTTEERYVLIKENDGGCWTSSIGYPSRDKRVIVALGVGCRSNKGITHEVLHAAGFFHEHNRPDRKDFLRINWDNIKDGKRRRNFKLENKYFTTSIPYDYQSIMHYGPKAFAKDKSTPTLVALKSFEGKMGGSKLSALDIQRINAFYKC